MGRSSDWFRAILAILVVFLLGAGAAAIAANQFVDEDNLNAATLDLANSGGPAAGMLDNPFSGESPLDSAAGDVAASENSDVQRTAYIEPVKAALLSWLYILLASGAVFAALWQVLALRKKTGHRTANVSMLGWWLMLLVAAVAAAVAVAALRVWKLEAVGYATSGTIAWSAVLGALAMSLLFWLATGVGVRHVLTPSVPFFKHLRR